MKDQDNNRSVFAMGKKSLLGRLWNFQLQGFRLQKQPWLRRELSLMKER